MIEEFLQPISAELRLHPSLNITHTIGGSIDIHFDRLPSLDQVNLALIGVEEDRRAPANAGTAQAPDKIREQLYGLSKGNFKAKIADLGNLRAGASPQDTYIGLGKIISELHLLKIIPVIIGGSQDLTYGQYLGYANAAQIANIAVIDESIDVYQDEEGLMSATSYLYNIFTESPNFLFHFSQVGYQSHFVPQEAIDILEQFHFEFLRLSEARENFEEVEPAIRSADMVSFDIGAIRQSDAPGKANATPNGFFGEEACRIARYAGITYKVSSIGFYEANPRHDLNDQTSKLVAQMIWYFLEGYQFREPDRPGLNRKNYTKFLVNLSQPGHDLVFWKSNKTGRWWMEMTVDGMEQDAEHRWVPCSYADYQQACRNEVPERWLRANRKLAGV